MIDKTRTIHGSLVSVNEAGILIVGESGIGKSRLCLEAVRRSHKLVADDAVEIESDGKSLIGRAPEGIVGLIEIRGVGIVDVRRQFGSNAFCRETKIHAYIDLSFDLADTNEDFQLCDSKELFGVQLPWLRPREATVIYLETIASNVHITAHLIPSFAS